MFSLVSVPVFLSLMLLSFYYLSIYDLPLSLCDELWIPNKKNQSEAGAFFKWSLSPTVDFLILTVGSVLNPTALNFLAVVDEVGLIVGHSRRKPSSKRQVCLSWAYLEIGNKCWLVLNLKIHHNGPILSLNQPTKTLKSSFHHNGLLESIPMTPTYFPVLWFVSSTCLTFPSNQFKSKNKKMKAFALYYSFEIVSHLHNKCGGL